MVYVSSEEAETNGKVYSVQGGEPAGGFKNFTKQITVRIAVW